MPLSKTFHTQATAKDLAWFNLDNYGGLKGFTAQDWARLVGDRLNLRKAIDGGNPEAVASVFETLKKEPLRWLGSNVRYVGADHAANTATVKPMNLRRLLFLVDELESLPTSREPEDVDGTCFDSAADRPDAVVDEILATNPASSFHRFAHIAVSIEAPRAQIIKDFAAWLDGCMAQRPKGSYREGDYLKKAKNQWILHCAVPYFDLKLYESLVNKEIQPALFWGKLFPNYEHEALKTKKKDAKSAAALAFSDDTYRLLRHLAYQKTS